MQTGGGVKKSENFADIIQSVFSALSQGLEDEILESSIGMHGQ